MNSVVLLALAATVVAAVPTWNSYNGYPDPSRSVEELVFRPGVEYKYIYETQVLSGVKTASKQVAGLKIFSKVRVQIHRGGVAVLKMEDVHLKKIHTTPSESYHTSMLPEEHLTDLLPELISEIETELRKPITFRYVEGEVRDVRVVPTDPYWSVNIKKGILSLLQLKLNQQSSSNDYNLPLYPESSISRPKNKIFESLFSSPFRSSFPYTKLDNVFHVMESDVSGDCEVKYSISSDKSSEYSSVSNMHVTKVKNFNKCLTKNSYTEGLFAGLPHFSNHRNMIENSVHSDYVISGDRYHFLIRSAKLHSKFTFSPSKSYKTGHISTHVLQFLTLQNTEPISVPLNTESTVKPERRGLELIIPNTLYQSQYPTDESIIEPMEPSYYSQKIDKFLSLILEQLYSESPEDKSSLTVGILTQLLRRIPSNVIVGIVKSYSNPSEVNYKKQQILLDVLPTVPSPHIVKVVAELIRSGVIRGVRAHLSINGLALTIQPTPEVVGTLMHLYKDISTVSSEHINLRKPVLLAVGTVCNKMINTLRQTKKPIPELVSTIEKISSELLMLLQQSPSEEEKILVLKTIGNMGAKEFSQPLVNIIEERSEPTPIRIEAVFALRKLVKIGMEPRERQVLMSTLLNKQEPEELRASLMTLVEKSPLSHSSLQLIAQSLLSEPSSQIRSFFYSILVNIASLKTNVPEEKHLVKNVRSILKTIPSIPVGPLDSKSVLLQLFSERLDVGCTASVNMLKSSMSGLPKFLSGSLTKEIFGKKFSVVSGGVEGKGIEKLVRNLLGPYGMIGDILKGSSSLYDIVKPLTSIEMGEVQYKIKNIMSKLMMQPHLDEKVLGSFYLQLLGQEVHYGTLDSWTVNKLTHIVRTTLPMWLSRLSEGHQVNMVKTLASVDNTLVLPTPAGIPLSLNVSAVLTSKVDGYIKVKNIPSWSMIRSLSLPEEIEVETDLKPKVNVMVYGAMGLTLNKIITSTGVILKSSSKLPIKGSVSVNTRELKLTTKYDIPTKNVKLINAVVIPHTNVVQVPRHVFAPETRVLMEPVPLDTSEFIRNKVIEKTLSSQVAGIELKTNVGFTSCSSHWCIYPPMSGVHQLNVELFPLKSGFQQVYFKIQSAETSMMHIVNKVLNTVSSTPYPVSPSGISRWTSGYNTYSGPESYDMFENVEPESFLTSPYKSQVIVEVGESSSRFTEKVKARLTWWNSPNFLEHQLSAQMVVLSNVQPTVKINLKVAGISPITLMYPSIYPKSKDLLGKMWLTWSGPSVPEGFVKSKLYIIDEPRWIEEVQKSGFEPEPNTTPNTVRLALDSEFSYINHFVMKNIVKATHMMKHYLYSYTKTNLPEGTIIPNRITVFGKIMPSLQKVSVLLKTPREISFVKNAPVPLVSTVTFYRPELHDLHPSFYHSPKFSKPHYRYSKPSLKGECEVTSSHIKTFDGLIVPLPTLTSSSCELLLAHDCSERNLFSVVAVPSSYSWLVKVYVPMYHIELQPSTRSVVVNGETRHITSEPLVLPSLSQSSRSPLYTIKSIGDGIELNAQKLRMKIIVTNSKKVIVKLSPWSLLQGQLCGVCGNHNYDMSSEFYSPSKKLLSSSAEFIKGHLIPSDTCTPSSMDTSMMYTSSCKKQITKTIKSFRNGMQEICFSKQPVSICSSGCSPSPRSSHVTLEVPFVCMPVSSPRTMELFKKSSYSSVPEIESFPVSFHRKISTPEICVPSY